MEESDELQEQLHETSFAHTVGVGVVRGLRTFAWLMMIMIPFSLLVTLLQYAGLVALIASVLEAPFRAIGLPGSAALVLVTSLTLSLYPAIGVMTGLGLTVRSMTILALVCLIAHNYFVELAVTRRTGTPVVRMFLVRTLAAFLAGGLLHLLLPETGSWVESVGPALAGGASSLDAESVGELIYLWGFESLRLAGRVLLIVTGLMTSVAVLERYGISRRIAARLGAVMELFGLSRNVAFLWVVSNTLGLAYGAGVLVCEVDSGRVSPEEGDLLNHHLGISHSLLEDTLLFVALGVPALAITLPRLLLAALAVWERRWEQRLGVATVSVTATAGRPTKGE
ncbi:MAG: nucleoside recognition protein [Alkalispirochaetaceae bacterium]